MLEFINKYLLGATVPIVLMLTGLYFLFKLRFFPITKFRRVAGAFAKNGKSSFRALALSLAGTLGVGNVAGVSAAIFSGGFGAIFWMWISACVAAVLKYAEVVLAMRRRVPSKNGFKGGAPYYIRALLPTHGKALSTVFALLCICNCLSMGAVIQTGAVAEALDSSLSVPPLLCGAILAIFCFSLMRGGAEKITSLTSALVPFMSLFYVVLSLTVIIPRRALLPSLFLKILSEAFTPESASGGIFGFLLSRALRFGVMRGLFSNEAGCGTSPTAHINSNAPPCEQGFMGVAEVFIDTLLLCSLTGFTLMLNYSEAAELSHAPIKAVIAAYSAPFPPPIGKTVALAMSFAVLCFGFATISCLSHYALECADFVSKKPLVKKLLIPAYSLFVLLGGVIPSEKAWAISDVTVGVMTLINLFVLILGRNEIAIETKFYFAGKKICTPSGKNSKTP